MQEVPWSPRLFFERIADHETSCCHNCNCLLTNMTPAIMFSLLFGWICADNDNLCSCAAISNNNWWKEISCSKLKVPQKRYQAGKELKEVTCKTSFNGQQAKAKEATSRVTTENKKPKEVTKGEYKEKKSSFLYFQIFRAFSSETMIWHHQTIHRGRVVKLV